MSVLQTVIRDTDSAIVVSKFLQRHIILWKQVIMILAGRLCETHVDCLLSPCLNDGTCVSDSDGYTCQCAPGYTGDNCQVLVCYLIGRLCSLGGFMSSLTVVVDRSCDMLY